MTATADTWRVGELAAATGLTVRTLHHYDRIGLVTASGRTSGNHRVYSAADVRRLYAVVALRRLGLSTDRIADELSGTWSLRALAATQRRELDRQLAALTGLRRELDDLLAGPEEIAPTEVIAATARAATWPTQVRAAVALLPYAELEPARDWLVAAFGFAPGPVTYDAGGTPVHTSVITVTGIVHLHPPTAGLSPPGPDGPATAMVVVSVDDADAHAAQARAHGARNVYGPSDMPYGVREYGAADPAGHLWSFQAPLPPTRTDTAHPDEEKTS